MRHVRNCVSAQRRTLRAGRARGPGRIRGRCTRRCAITIPVHHVIPPDTPDNDYWVLARLYADVWQAARNHETFSSARGLTVTYGELELIGLPTQPALRDAGPPGAHRVPETGVTRIHPTPGRGRRAQSARVRRRQDRRIAIQRRRGHRRRTVPNRCRRWWWRTTSECPKNTGHSSICGTDAIVAANTATGSLTQNLARRRRRDPDR